jgi:hypothetical protein
MIEHLARALCRQRIAHLVEEPAADFIARAEEHLWPDFVDDAHAVIEAMQQLGPQIVIAGLHGYPGPQAKDTSENGARS